MKNHLFLFTEFSMPLTVQRLGFMDTNYLNKGYEIGILYTHF